MRKKDNQCSYTSLRRGDVDPWEKERAGRRQDVDDMVDQEESDRAICPVARKCRNHTLSAIKVHTRKGISFQRASHPLPTRLVHRLLN